jgi:hypothetical protein
VDEESEVPDVHGETALVSSMARHLRSCVSHAMAGCSFRSVCVRDKTRRVRMTHRSTTVASTKCRSIGGGREGGKDGGKNAHRGTGT